MNLDIFWEATTCMPYAIKKVEKLKEFVCLPDWGYWHDDVTNKIALNAIVKHFNYQVKNCSFQKRNSSFTEPKQ